MQSLKSMIRAISFYFLLLGVFGFAGCASIDAPTEATVPDTRFTGALAQGQVSGDRSLQVMGAVEARLLRAFPNAVWISDGRTRADVLLDINVYSARISDTRSNQETRVCRRWSEPDKDARGTVQRLISRTCVDWQTQVTPCVNRRYELDVQFRARNAASGRMIVSDRKVASSSNRLCGDGSISTDSLQAQAETDVAEWAMALLRKVPLADGASSRAHLQNLREVDSSSSFASQSNARPERLESSSSAFPGRPIEAHALVIGNANYPGSGRLANPINDAQAISKKLSDLGFKVSRVDDGDREKMVNGLIEFQRKAANSQVTILYYSGHGMQIDGINYLLPVNIDINKSASLRLQALALDTIIDSYIPGRTRLIFLDACRDNPFVSSAVRGFGRGLAPIRAPAGTLIAYATKDGGVAEDGTGRNSPFTEALLDLITEPEDISLVLRKVRDRVMQATNGRQQPWEYGSLSGGALVLSRLQGR